MVINNNTYATLMKPDRFLKYTPFHVALPHKHTQVLVALQQSGKEEVDALMTKAISMGAVEFRAAQDHGLMYARSFHDHDGNIFEIFWMQMPSLA
jgi:predicted lactoylglutathione lyase